MIKSPELKLSKLDVAKRQLETVIRLYFSHGDPVSIHTLTAASYNVIRDLNKNNSGEKLFAKDRFMDYVKEGHEKEVWDFITSAENFFKHADRDHDEILNFKPEQSEILIFEGCVTYYKLSREFPPLFRLYYAWFIAHHSNWFRLNEENTLLVKKAAPYIAEMARGDYFNTMLPELMKLSK